MNRDQLRRYAAIAYAGLAGEKISVATVKPKPGLHLLLSRQDDAMSLKAIQQEQPIDPEDLLVIAAAFQVPPDTDPSRCKRWTYNKISERATEWYTATWSWREI